MGSFMEFYDNLDTIDLILIWVGIFVLFLIVCISIYLYKKNKQLVSLIKKKEEELKTKEKVVEDNKIKINNETNISNKKKKDFIDNNIIVSKDINDDEKKIDKDEKEYKNNILKKNDRRYQTSPISIDNNIKEVKEDKKENISFTEKIAKQMEKEIKPQTIDLTDFEKKQEDEAIISYQELLSSSKDKLYHITDDEETTDFIEELKSFRSKL